MVKREAAVSADALEDDYLVEDIIEEGDTQGIAVEEDFEENAPADQGSASIKRKVVEDIAEESTKKKKKRKPKKVRKKVYYEEITRSVELTDTPLIRTMTPSKVSTCPLSQLQNNTNTYYIDRSERRVLGQA